MQRLREELAQKEAELEGYKQTSRLSKHDLYNRFNKELWDKQVTAEGKVTTLSAFTASQA
jgi:hypothetical protein